MVLGRMLVLRSNPVSTRQLPVPELLLLVLLLLLRL
jgi:hypothetical protein